MNIKSIVIPGTLVLSLGLAVLPANAEPQRGRDEGRRASPSARLEQRRALPRSAPLRGYDMRGYGTRRGGGRPVYIGPRAFAPYRVGPRVVVPPAFRYYGRAFYGRRPFYFARPYYVFRPRIGIGFGFWIGYPVPYPYVPYGYGSPYPYPPAAANPAYGYPPADGSASAAAYGGVSFEITPADAAVYVDGSYAGTCAEFAANAQPLTLDPGRHRIEVQAEGYRPMVFDADVVAGQVIPYRGALQPY